MKKIALIFMLMIGLMCSCGTELPEQETTEIPLDHSPAMGGPADPDSFRDNVYHFEKVESRGVGDLRLSRIEVESREETEYTELLWNDWEYVIINECEPPVPKEIFDISVPDFLTEEQQNLYRRAHRLYYLLKMYPGQIETMPRKDGENYDVRYPTLYLSVSDSRGYTGSFYQAKGRYSAWDDFASMGTSVFTRELFKNLCQPNFFRINDGTYYLDTRNGGGYYYEDPAVTYHLISSSETEIEFEAVKHINRFPDTESDTENTVSLPVKMILTDEGWRVSMMDFEYNGEQIEPDEDAYAKAMAEICATEKLVINYVYESKKFTIIHGIQNTGMKNAQRLWIVYPDGRYSDISRSLDFNENIRLTDFRVLYDDTVLFCEDEEAELYPGCTLEYEIDIMTGEIISKTKVVRTVLD